VAFTVDRCWTSEGGFHAAGNHSRACAGALRRRVGDGGRSAPSRVVPERLRDAGVPQDEEALGALPRIAAGLDTDPAPYTVDDLVALGNEIDENGDGQFCLKAVSNLNGNSVKVWAFFYGARDNDSATS
jgi:hypothetical protein